MSQWTHVAGIIRLDSISMVLGQYLPSEMGMIITRSISRNTPSGSEGPIHVHITEYPGIEEYGGQVQWGYIAIWGDLRDFGDENDIATIHQWLRDTIDNFNRNAISIRDLVVRANVEYGHTYLFQYDQDMDLLGTLTLTERKDWMGDEEE